MRAREPARGRDFIFSASQKVEPSGQLGNHLGEFGLGPGSGGVRPHVALRAERECEFGDVVSVAGIHDRDYP
jgi:hypothetical protein